MKMVVLLVMMALMVALLFFLMQPYSYEDIVHLKASKFKIEIPIEPTVLYMEKEIYNYILSE